MHARLQSGLILFAVAVLLASSAAEAQWVLLARRAVGRVEQMSQTQPSTGVTYDTAVVLLDAPADKVYATALRRIKTAEGISITLQDDSARTIQFTNGQQIAGLKVSPLADDLSHIMISSAHSGSQPNAATLIQDSILRICKDMNVECSQAK
jgi:hypothetical protein